LLQQVVTENCSAFEKTKLSRRKIVGEKNHTASFLRLHFANLLQENETTVTHARKTPRVEVHKWSSHLSRHWTPYRNRFRSSENANLFVIREKKNWCRFSNWSSLNSVHCFVGKRHYVRVSHRTDSDCTSKRRTMNNAKEE